MIRINLLPTKAARKKESVIQQLIVGAVCLVVTIGVCWRLYVGKNQEIEAAQAHINELNQQIRELEAIKVKVDDFKKKKRDLNKKIDTIKELNDNRSGPVRFLEEFTYVIPRKAWITTFREVEKQLTLEGLAVDGPTVADFIDNLRGSKFFTNVQLIQVQSTSKAGLGKIQRFNINCRITYSPKGAG